MSYNFDVDEFPPFYGQLSLPKGTVLYCDTKIFRTKKEIRLYDFRYVKMILLDLLTYCKKDTEYSMNACKVLALSYGICSLERQLELVKEFYSTDSDLYKLLYHYENSNNINNLVEPQGVRIIERENDTLSSYLLKYLLRHMVDGIITNKMYSINNNNLVNNTELMLFDVDKNNLLEEIDETCIQIKETLDWKYWLDSYNEVHYRSDNINREFYITAGHNDLSFSLEKTKRFDEFAKEVISELVDRASLVPFTPKFTALDIAPWSIDFIKDTY